MKKDEESTIDLEKVREGIKKVEQMDLSKIRLKELENTDSPAPVPAT